MNITASAFVPLMKHDHHKMLIKEHKTGSFIYFYYIFSLQNAVMSGISVAVGYK